jgi:hypothetical protein
MATRFNLPFADVGSGIKPSDGAQLFFYETGTDTLKNTWTTSAASVANSNPVIANAIGVFPAIFLTGDYWVTLKDKNNVQSWAGVPISSNLSETSATIAALIADASVQAGVLVSTAGYGAAGDSGGASYLPKTASQASSDGDFIGGYVNHAANNGLKLILQPVNGSVLATQCGVTPTGDSNLALTDFFLYITSKNIKGVGIDNGSHDVTSELINAAVSMDFDGRGCTFNKKSNNRIFYFNNPLLNTLTASLSIASVDLNSDTGSATTTCSIVTVSDTSSYNINDVVKVFSNDLMIGEDPANNHGIGEFATVVLKTSTTLTLFSTLRYNYTTGIKVARLDSSKSLNIKNFFIDGSGFDDSWARPSVSVVGYDSPYIESLQGEDLPATMLRFISCYKPMTRNVSGKNIRTRIDQDAFGYVVHESSVESGRHYELAGDNTRHVYTCSARTSSSGLAEDYGNTYLTRVYGGVGRDSQSAAWDTHPDADDVRFVSCTAVAPFWGVNGSFTNYSFRGRNCGADNCYSSGGRGYSAISDYASADNSRDHTLNDCTHEFLPNDSQNLSAFRIFGIASGLVTMTVNNPKTINNLQDKPSFEVDYGTMKINGIDIINKFSGTDARIFEANTEAKIYCDGGLIDSTTATGTDLNLANITVAGSIIDVKNLTLKGGDYNCLIDMAGVNGTFYAKNINLTDSAAISPVAGALNLGASAAVGIDYVEEDGRSGTRAQTPAILVNGASGFAIDLEYRYANSLRVPVVASVAGGNISSITSGLFFGQSLTITSKTTSAQSFVITNGGNFGIGANLTVGIAEAHSFWWDGFDWVNA